MEIIFLGSGGGRVNLVKQIRGTGGFRISSDSAKIHVDPGPGALLASIKTKQDPAKLDAIVISHGHVDHFSDAMVLMEGMSGFGSNKRGILIGSKQAIEGTDKGDRAVHLYYQNRVAEVYAAAPGDRKTFQTAKGSFEMEFIGMIHDEKTAVGFKLEMDGKMIGYITDTEYKESFGEAFSGCDLLIVNCLKPSGDKYHGHLTTGDTIKILKGAKPKQCVITHLGMKMIGIGEKEAKKIEKESGVKTIAAEDGMKLVV
ncbi:MBL fold metallo-hydrolase [Candidatus Micrarchaeota archaeon]|nr:MBL fold metallo-hydrolase [Candidatus Micrarchaeota archaeon]